MDTLALPTASHPAVTPFAFMFLIVGVCAVITPLCEVYKGNVTVAFV